MSTRTCSTSSSAARSTAVTPRCSSTRSRSTPSTNAAFPGINLRLRNKLFLPAMLAVFTLSGFAGLVYESIWSHYLKLFLGHSGHAQTLVLAIFMGGMALGAGLAARYSHRWRNLLIAYAVVEAAVGVIAFGFHETFVTVTEIAFDRILPAAGTAGAAGPGERAARPAPG